jgi:hypothetical protein
MRKKYNPITNLGNWAKPIPKNRRCMKCGSSKTKIEDDGCAHWYKGHPNGEYATGYLCDKCRGQDYGWHVDRIHRRIYEQHYNVCLLRWTEIRFRNGDKTDKRIENLETVVRGTHANLAKGLIPKNRRCVDCGRKSSGNWYKRENGFICVACLHAAKRRDSQRTKERTKEINELSILLEKAKKLEANPNFVFEPPHRCTICGSTTSGKKSKARGESPDWYRLNPLSKNSKRQSDIKEGEQAQCYRCYHEKFYVPSGGLIKAWQKALKDSFPKRSNAAYKRVWRRAKNPSMKPFIAARETPKQCLDCGGTTTGKNSKGHPNWYKLVVPNRPVGYLDSKCYMRRRRNLKAIAAIPQASNQRSLQKR